MTAAIEINEQWIAIPAALAGLGLLVYALWPATTSKRAALSGGLLLILVAAFAYAVGDPRSSPTPKPSRPDAVVVVPVTPVAGSLAELVPAAERGKIGRFYLSLAEVITQADNLKTTEDLRAAYVSAGRVMKRACQLPEGLSGFTEATQKLFASTISLETQPVTPAVREKFAATCRSVAAELGVTP